MAAMVPTDFWKEARMALDSLKPVFMLAEAWEPELPRHHRECNIRQFAKVLKSQGYENIYIQYDCTVKMPRDYIPYVFSNAEMKRIFSVIDSREAPMTAMTHGFFIRRLSGCCTVQG